MPFVVGEEARNEPAYLRRERVEAPVVLLELYNCRQDLQVGQARNREVEHKRRLLERQ